MQRLLALPLKVRPSTALESNCTILSILQCSPPSRTVFDLSLHALEPNTSTKTLKLILDHDKTNRVIAADNPQQLEDCDHPADNVSNEQNTMSSDRTPHPEKKKA